MPTTPPWTAAARRHDAALAAPLAGWKIQEPSRAFEKVSITGSDPFSVSGRLPCYPVGGRRWGELTALTLLESAGEIVDPEFQGPGNSKERIHRDVDQSSLDLSEVLGGQVRLLRQPLLGQSRVLAMNANSLAKDSAVFPERHGALTNQEAFGA